MFSSIRQFFAQQLEDTLDADVNAPYQLATAALLVEMVHADADESADELQAVRAALKSAFDLDDDTITTIIKLAQDERDAATCLHEFTRSLNDVLDTDGRTRVVELLWQVAYADGRLDVYEEHLVRKVADLLHVPHSAYIHAKLRAAPSA
ncbi:MAG: hypothetical protein CMQ61_13855 [Gammaproteobacteria bacterium]|nr:hypothetical protein [Gammaproteobacteria bacterium]|tara:strand:+ start:524 stop:973 length:450 start_codon:yes stop_codon:yes gene_type:complete